VLIQIIRDEVLLYNKKLIMWCINSAQQLTITGTLALCDINARIFHTELTTTERQELINKFTTKLNSVTVLVCSYYRIRGPRWRGGPTTYLPTG
jgi:hypothetical protein